MEKIQVKKDESGNHKCLVFGNSDIVVADTTSASVYRFTPSDCDYIRENNLTEVEIEAELLRCEIPEVKDRVKLQPKLYGGFVSVIHEPKRKEPFTSTPNEGHIYDAIADALTYEVNDEVTYPYLRSEMNAQIKKLKLLGINTTGQTFEQMINELIMDNVHNNTEVKDEELEAGKVMSASEFDDIYKGSNNLWEMMEAYADYRVKAENLFTEQDMCNLIQSLKNYTREGNVILGFDEREPQEFLNNFLTEYKKQRK